VALRHLGLAGLHGLGADLPRQVLGAHLPVAMHQHDQRPGALVLHHQRLDHGMFVGSQLARGFRRAAVLDIVIRVFAEFHAGAPQPLCGRRFADMRRLLAHDITVSR
jgi:hypothetical protein